MQKLLLCLMILLPALIPLQAADEDSEAPATTSAYISLGKPMVLNLSGTKRLTFLQISADVLISNADSESIIETHIPAIRHSLILALSEQDAADIKSPNKREEIRQKATTQIKALVAELSGNEDISDILFSSILVQ